MQKNILGIVIAGVLLVLAAVYIVHLRTENQRLKGGDVKAVVSSSSTAGRVITAEQRKIMVEKLSGGSAYPVWFATVANNPEAAEFQKQLQSVFEEAGWTMKSNVPVG